MEWTPRLPWDDVPATVRAVVEERLGGRVVSAEATVGGFSAGFAGIVTSSRRSFFVKATSAVLNEHGRELYRRERRVCQLLADHGAGAGLRWSADVGDWTVLGFDVVEGHIYDPGWAEDRELDEVLEALAARRAPAPPGLAPLGEVLDDLFAAWGALAADASFDAWPDPGHAALDRPVFWCGLADRARAAFAGDELLHADLRADNLLRTPQGPVLVDWAYACRGHGAFDPVYLLLEVARTRGSAPDAALERVVRSFGCDADDATSLLASFDGWFTWMSRQPPVPALPGLRAFQTEMSAAARSWVRDRLAAPLSRPLVEEVPADA